MPVLRAQGAEVIELFCEADDLSNHHPDPTVEHNLIDLKAQSLSIKPTWASLLMATWTNRRSRRARAGDLG